MTDPVILKAATRALQAFPHEHIIADDYSYMAEALIAAAEPLIEEAALKRWHHDLAHVRVSTLEEAAKVADEYPDRWEEPEHAARAIRKLSAAEIAGFIRALKEKP